MIDYISAQEAAEKWSITRRHVQLLCAEGKIPGAKRFTYVWMIPADAERPPDGRRLENKKIKQTEGGGNGEHK